MRTHTMLLTLAFTAAMLASCSSKEGKPPAAAKKPAAASRPSKTPTSGQAGGATAVVVKAGNSAVLRLTLPAGVKSYAAGEKTTFVAKNDARFYLWTIASTKTPDVARVGEIIKSEFKGFKSTGTRPLTFAGIKASQIVGTGTEADDGDDGQAEVLVFEVGGHVFVACVHGEEVSNAKRDLMMTVLKTAKGA